MQTPTIYLFFATANTLEAQQIAQDFAQKGLHCVVNESAADKKAGLLQDEDAKGILLVSDNYLKAIDEVRELDTLLGDDLIARVYPVLTHGRRPKTNDPSVEEVYPTRIQTLNNVMYYRDFWYETWIDLRKVYKNSEGAEQEKVGEEKEIAKQMSVGSISTHIRKINNVPTVDWELFCADEYQQFLGSMDILTEGLRPLEPVPVSDTTTDETTKETTTEQVILPVNPETVAEPSDSVDDGADNELEVTGTKETESSEEQSEEQTEETAADATPSEEAEKETEELLEETPKILINELVPEAEDLNGSEHTEETTTEASTEADPVDPEQVVEALYEAAPEVEDIDVLFHVAERQVEEDEFDAAKYTYERILKIDPYNGRAIIWLARLLDKHYDGREMEAAHLYRKAIMLNDDNANLYYEYALLQQSYFKAYNKANEAFQEALEIDPRFEEAYFGLAECQLQMGMLEQAKANYLQACILDADRFETAENDERFAVVRSLDLEAELSEEEAEAKAAEAEALAVPVHPNANRVVLVTGATSGIGRAIATSFIKDGYKVIITGRRAERLQALQESLIAELEIAQIHPLVFDVRDKAAVDSALAGLPEDWQDIEVLVNNAGLAKGFGGIHEGEVQHWETMIDTNIKGLLYVTRAVSPGMVSRQKGHIINIGSVAGSQAYPGGNVYCATKAAVESLTKAMRLDLYQHNIRVTAVNPGHVDATEFAAVRYEDAEKANIYEDFKPLAAQDVADTVHYIATRPSHVGIQEVLMMGTQQATARDIDRSGRGEKEQDSSTEEALEIPVEDTAE